MWSDGNVLSCVSDDVIRIEWIPASPTGSEQIHNLMLRREEAEKHFQVPPTASSFQRRSAGWLMTQLLFTPRRRSGGIPWEGESDDINPLFHVRRQPSMFEAVGEERCLGEMSLLESPAGFTGTLWLSGGMMCFWVHRLNVDWWTSSRADQVRSRSLCVLSPVKSSCVTLNCSYQTRPLESSSFYFLHVKLFNDLIYFWHLADCYWSFCSPSVSFHSFILTVSVNSVFISHHYLNSFICLSSFILLFCELDSVYVDFVFIVPFSDF